MIDLFALLSTAPDVNALVGTRVYPLLLPTSPTLPAIEYAIISCVQTQTFDNAGTQKWRVEINCWAKTYGEASAVRDAVVGSLNGYRSGNTVIQLLTIQDFPYAYQLEQFRCMAEFYVFTSGFGAMVGTPPLA